MAPTASPACLIASSASCWELPTTEGTSFCSMPSETTAVTAAPIRTEEPGRGSQETTEPEATVSE